jgi:hypothetical protein
MKKLLLLLLLCPFVLNKIAYTQGKGGVLSYNNFSIVKKYDIVFYYGVDFSHLRITDGPKISKSKQYSIVYPIAWISYVEKQLPPFEYVQKSLEKILVYKQDEIVPISINVISNFIIESSYSYTIDTVIAAIRQYKLNQKTGLGMVLIPENFNKHREIAMIWVVFFNISTREIYWATKVYGKCSHMGYTAHWASGVVDAFKKFIHSEYK